MVANLPFSYKQINNLVIKNAKTIVEEKTKRGLSKLIQFVCEVDVIHGCFPFFIVQLFVSFLL
jgi:hypothetical protein